MPAPPTPSEYVTLISNDGFEFIVRRSSACVSGALKRMLNTTSGFSEAVQNRAILENVNGACLEKICEYFYYHQKYQGMENVPDMELPVELCLELLMAADYLNV
ncbi:MAG: hypothetical protein M1823_005558 [Watsoniomyces obsoletus]|nr:MAG: hypothetical protein M1823_005558 [Watsoniomyces obsoletus]